MYRINSGRLFSPEEKQPWACLLEVQDCERSGGHFPGKKTLSALVRRSGLPEIQGLFFPGETHQRWARPCSGLPENPEPFFSGKKKHSLEHACWTFRASKKSNSAKVIFYCKANQIIFPKQLSCAAQITQGAYTDVAFWFHPKRLSLRTQDQTLTLIFFWKRRNPYTPSQIRFSNGLAYNRSKVQNVF